MISTTALDCGAAPPGGLCKVERDDGDFNSIDILNKTTMRRDVTATRRQHSIWGLTSQRGDAVGDPETQSKAIPALARQNRASSRKLDRHEMGPRTRQP